MKLPKETIYSIIREATRVPEALDTSPSTFPEDRDAMVKLIKASMLTKTSLSLVSKTFHNITEYFLYEIVMIFQFKYVPVLYKLLRSTSSGHRNPCGHTCRRLDFYLGVGEGRYTSQAWFEGGHILWGLIPACPRLEVLLCQIVYNQQWNGGCGIPSPEHLTHNSLWKTVAAFCAGSLRRLELVGFYIRMDRVEMMLRYLTKLEACRIVHAREFDPEDGDYDEEEPDYRSVGFRKSIAMKEWEPSGLFDEAAQAEFEIARQGAGWPVFDGSGPPYLLPSLHTFHLNQFNAGITQLQLPSLQNLGVINVFYDVEPILSEAHTAFPSSLVHLTYSGIGLPLNTLLTFFPNLETLTVCLKPSTEFYPSVFSEPVNSLAFVNFIHDIGEHDTSAFVDDILSGKLSGMLPRLHNIQVTRYDAWGQDELPFQRSEALGVELKLIQKKQQRYIYGSS